ncbi:hypothetical protein ACIXSV_07395 [Bacteroides fragilis]
MEAKELRLGNYVKLSKDYQYVGITIPSGTIFKVESIETNSLYLKCNIKDGTFYGKIPVSMVEPIPLTEELLLKSGFTKEYYGRYLHNDGVDDDKLFASINSAEYPLSRTPIEYLHQLQNIYLDLSGKELEISYEYQRGEMSLI